MNIARNIIDKCGGAARVAQLVGIDKSNVHRWTYPKERGGSDGLIPAIHQQKLLAAAKIEGIDLSPDDFFTPEVSANG